MKISKEMLNDGYEVVIGDHVVAGVQSFDTETCEAQMLMMSGARHLDDHAPTGTTRYVRGKMDVGTVKIDGAFARFRGERVREA